MEWFCRVEPPLSQEEISARCRLRSLPEQCASIYKVENISADRLSARIECVWGIFTVVFTPIRNGVRYTLVNCPNALQWTITTDGGGTLIHCSINQETTDSDFADSIQQLMEDFRLGLGFQKTEQ